MRKSPNVGKKARGTTGWWKHLRSTGKRAANKSERRNVKASLKE